MNEEEKHILIDKYLAGELDADSKKMFEEELKSNSEIKKEFEWQKELYHFLGEDDLDLNLKYPTEDLQSYEAYFESTENNDLEKSLKRVAKNINKNGDITSQPKRSINKRWLSIAASVVLLFGAYWIINNQTISPYKLYEQYASHEVSWTTKGDNDQLLVDAENAFDEKNFVIAKDKLNEYLLVHNEDDDKRLALGIAEMELANYSEAEAIFKLVKQNLLMSDQAQWNLLLLYLKSGESENAKSMISEITLDTQHYKIEDVQKINKRLKK